MVNILVIGSTGQQGGATAHHLLQSRISSSEPVHLYALTRNPTSPAAKKLQDQGVQLKQGDLSDITSFKTALQGMDRVFLVTIPHGKGGAQAEIEMGKAFLDAAHQAGIKHLVYSSVESCDKKSEVPHWDSKYIIENTLKESGIPSWTILRPVSFMENFPLEAGFGRAMGLGFFQAAIGDMPLQVVSVQDIGKVAAAGLLSPDEYKGKEISIAGDELTIPQVVGVMDKVFYNGKPMTNKVWLPAWVVILLPNDWRKMFKFLRVRGYSANITEIRKQYPDFLSFEDFLKSKIKKD